MPPRPTLADLEARYAHARSHLATHQQEHLLRWWSELSADARATLLGEIEAVPWAHVEPLIHSHVRHNSRESVPTNLQPAPVVSRAAIAAARPRGPTVIACGEELLRRGRVAAFTVAGGQGTRLGVAGPKGTVAVTPIRKKTLFQLFAEMVLGARRRYGAPLRWYIMTSPANHEQTVAFFQEHRFFGLPEEDVRLFPQGMLPSFDLSGRVLLAEKHRLALAPDGHGGSLKALAASGALRDLQARGIEVISYFQVDNPLVQPFDPIFIGLHAETGAEMSCKVCPKLDDFERVGNLCWHEGRTVVIEYSDLPRELAVARHADGARRFNVGNLAIHLLQVSFVDRIVGQHLALPYHRAEKTVAFVDDTGTVRTPTAPNAVKLETFVFDALPLAARPLLLEIDRAEEFSPVKNPHGPDSLETSIRDQVCRAARWFAAAGVPVPRQPDGVPAVTLEISPTLALDVEQFRSSGTRPAPLRPGDELYVE